MLQTVNLFEGDDVSAGYAVLLEEATDNLHTRGDLGALRRVRREHLLRSLVLE